MPRIANSDFRFNTGEGVLRFKAGDVVPEEHHGHWWVKHHTSEAPAETVDPTPEAPVERPVKTTKSK